MPNPTTRTDVHRPVEMDPADYEYIFAADTNTPWALGLNSTDEGRLFLRELANLDPATADRGYHQCHHCGARLRYVAWLRHLPTGYTIVVGETCLDNRFALQSKADFDRLRKAAQLDREAQRIKTAAREFCDALIDSEMAPVGEALDRETDLLARFDFDPEGYAFRTISDIRRKVWDRYGNATPGQVRLVDRLVQENTGEMARKARVAAERAAEVKVPAPSGRQEFSGVVVSRKWKDSDYGGAYKLTVKVETTGGIFLVWVSEPSKVETSRGDIVSLKATLTPSDRDPAFAFGKRPSNLTVIGRISEAQIDALDD